MNNELISKVYFDIKHHIINRDEIDMVYKMMGKNTNDWFRLKIIAIRYYYEENVDEIKYFIRINRIREETAYGCIGYIGIPKYKKRTHKTIKIEYYGKY